MIYIVCCVHDVKAGAFLPPFFVRNRAEAIRSFADAVRDDKHQFCRHPEDYTLFSIGGFDDEKGIVIPDTAPTALCKALDYVNSQE